ncbi:MAG: MFS transporter [Acidobacteriota bacterium]
MNSETRRTEEEAATGPSHRKPLAVLFFTVLIDLLGFGMILPLLPFYAQEFGASDFQIGLLLAAFSAAQLVMAPILGILSDRYGRRPVLLTAIAIGFFAYLLFAAPSLPGAPGPLATHGIWVLMVARFVAGSAAANFAVAPAYIADILPAGQRSKGMGMLGAAFGLGFVGGPALGALLGTWGLAAVALGPAVLSFVNWGLAYFYLPESLAAENRRRTPWNPFDGFRRLTGNPHLKGLLTLFFLVTLCFSLMEATLALYCQHRFEFGQRETAWLFVYIGVLLVIVQGGLIGRMARRFGDRRMAIVGIAGIAAGLLALPLAPGLATLGLAGALLAFGSGFYNPTSMALISRITGSATQGEVQGLSRFFGSLARVLGPLGGTWLFERVGPAMPFQAAAALMAATCLFAWPVLRRLRGPDGEPI